jgi:hypothetical protein
LTLTKSSEGELVPIADNTSGLDFQGPELFPAPVPELSAYQINQWQFLEHLEPIDDLSMLAFQVSQITFGMSELVRMIGEVQSKLEGLRANPDLAHLMARSDEDEREQ